MPCRSRRATSTRFGSGRARSIRSEICRVRDKTVPVRLLVLARGLIIAGCCILLVAPKAFAQPPSRPSGRVLFVIPARVGGDERVRLIDALTAQFAGQGARLDFRRFEGQKLELRAQVERAQQLMQTDDGIVGVFWLDTASDQSWMLYLTEPGGERVLVRRIDLTSSSESAAIEAVSVITSQSAEALRSGETIGMRPVDVPPVEPPLAEPQPQPISPEERPVPASEVSMPGPAPAPRRARMGPRLRAGYRGSSYAKGIFLHGFRVGGEWVSRSGFYGGIGAAFFGPVDFEGEFVGFQIRRTPVELVTGWQWAKSAISLDAEFAATVDLVNRTLVRRLATVQGSASRSRTVLWFGPRVRASYTLGSGFGFYVDVGVDMAVNNFSFVAQLDGEQRELLTPYSVRGVVDAGVLFWP